MAASIFSPESPWASLPLDLRELVLAHLSRSELLRLRSVSRWWLSLLTSHRFQRLHRTLHPRAHPSLLVYNHAVKISACNWSSGDGSGRESFSALWHDISLPIVFLREWVGAGALVCMRSHLSADAFSVGSPFSNEWKVLPNPPQARLLCKLWAMVAHTSVGGRSRSFSVLLLQLNSPSAYLDVYNSESKEWTRRAPPQAAQGPSISISFSSVAAVVGELVYSVQSESRRIITYDVQRDAWKTLDAPIPADLVFQAAMDGSLVQTMPHIIRSCRGKVLMVGAAASCTGNGVDDAVCAVAGDAVEAMEASGDGTEIINYAVVWELDWARKEWREMARAPPEMCAEMMTVAMEMRKAAVTPVKYSGHGELVVAMACGAQRAVQYDVIEEKWTWLDLPPAVNCDLTLCLQPIEL